MSIILSNGKDGYRYYNNNESSDTVDNILQLYLVLPAYKIGYASMCPETHDAPVLTHIKTTILLYIP